MLIDLLARICLAGLLCGFIGIERQRKAKDAGFRTHILVGVGSAMFMVASKYGFGDIGEIKNAVLDPSRIAAQIVSGVGFLGAGSIVLHKNFVKGLTTAAGLWVCAGIGVVIGCGLYVIGISSMIITLLVLEVFNQVGKKWTMSHYTLIIHIFPDKVDELFAFFKENNLMVSKQSLSYSIDEQQVCHLAIELASRKTRDITELYQKMLTIDGIAKMKLY